MDDPLVVALKAGPIPFKDACMTLRIALTGGTVSEPIGDLLRAVGRENVLKRLKQLG